MTKKEAIKWLDNCKNYLTAGNPIWNTDKVAEAFDYAISALEQPEIIRCKDCKRYSKTDIDVYWGTCGRWLEPVRPDDYCSYAERREDDERRGNQSVTSN